MYWLLLVTFVLGYVFIALERTVRVDKAATALITGVACWTILQFGRSTLLTDVPGVAGHLEESIGFLEHTLLEHVGEIAEILFFLMAAMTIVELVDAHRGSQVVTDRIFITGRVRLLWIICGSTGLALLGYAVGVAHMSLVA